MTLWATEDEAAKLCGMTPDRFKAHVSLLENEGFPRPSPWNGKRYRPAIEAFWHRQHGLDALLEAAPGSNHQADGRDKWGTNDA